MSELITISGQDGEPDRWARLREKKQRFKAGERRALYAIYDGLDCGATVKELTLVRYMLAHLIEEWSYDLPRPSADMREGTVIYEHLDSLDELDCEMEDELIAIGARWVKQIAINFSPSKDPESPTSPSGA